MFCVFYVGVYGRWEGGREAYTGDGYVLESHGEGRSSRFSGRCHEILDRRIGRKKDCTLRFDDSFILEKEVDAQTCVYMYMKGR